ncbi:MAG: tetratricopeptide repeat protein [bacterium]|nr:tetratricopeptide repeat protein [bacterium]
MTHDRMTRYFEMQQDRRPRGRFFIPLADLYRAAGRLESAAALLEEGLVRCADSLSARVVLARVRRDQGRLAGGARPGPRGADRDPGHREAPQLAGPAAAPAPVPPANLDPAALTDRRPRRPDLRRSWAGRRDRRRSTISRTRRFSRPWSPAAEPPPERSLAASAPVAETGQAPRFLTQTLAEIYLAQGHRQKALAILRRLLAEHPERDDVAREIAALEAVDATVDAMAGATVPAGSDTAPGSGGAPDGAATAADPNRARFEAWIDRQQGGPA